MLHALYWRFNLRRGSIINVIFRGRQYLVKLEVTPDAPRIVVDVSYVRKIHHQRYFLWQAQYLVMVEGDSCCPAPCTGRFMMCDESSMSFSVAGAIFGEVGR